MVSCCRKGRWPVTSRALVLILPFVVIVAFWLLARYESKLSHDPTHKSYWERNGSVLGIAFIALALWVIAFSIVQFRRVLKTLKLIEIPARYCTGYLSDAGMPSPFPPGDFAAWFEAYLDGAWYTFDPRNNQPRIGRILIARGRDAADVAMVTTFGPNVLEGFRVWADEVPDAA